MSWLNNISVKHKLIGLVLFVTTAVTLAGYSVITLRFAKEQERKFQSNIETNTLLLADYCIGPMSFNDSIETHNVLKRIENLPEIMSATVYDENNNIFVLYVADSASNLEADQSSFEKVRKEIKFRNIHYGWIEVTASRENISREIAAFMASNAGWLLLILFVGTLAAYRLQFVITRPLAKLSDTSRKISQEADYSIRLQREGKDEIAVVYNAFNNMLRQIEKRDEARNIVEKNLQEAKEKAERADQLKTSFLTNMSHEIRTPMNAILGFANLMIEEDLPPQQQKEYLKVIHESGSSLLNLVNDILDISKIEAGELTIAEGVCDVNTMFRELFVSFNEIKQQKKKSQVELLISNPFKNDRLLIKTDPYRVRQVLMNLIGNAIKFTDNGFIEFGINEKNGELLFYVKDTGIGIDKNHQKEIFQRFRKIDEEKSRLFRGAGLGLAICQDIVRLLGGDISVESTPGKGSVFSFTLPKRLVESKEHITKKQPVSDEMKINLNGKTIVIAEDESNNFKFLNQLLQRFNATIIWARDGEEAVSQVSKQKTDLVLMDLKMPKVDGYEATRRIKKAFPDMVIVAQSAYTSPEDVEKCYDAGCDYYISKPINIKELIATLKKVTS